MKIGMSHGAGGGIMQGLISEIILGNLKNKSVNGGVGLMILMMGPQYHLMIMKLL